MESEGGASSTTYNSLPKKMLFQCCVFVLTFRSATVMNDCMNTLQGQPERKPGKIWVDGSLMCVFVPQ